MTASTLRILLYDDDDAFRLALSACLALRGYTVLETSSDAEATQAVTRKAVDLALVTGRLHDADGQGWIDWLRRSGDHIPVIFVEPATLDRATAERLVLELRASVVVRTPLRPTPADLANAIDEHLQRSPPTPPRGATIATLAHEYGRRLPQKLQDIVQSLHSIKHARTREQESVAIDVARVPAHRLCGTASSYGFRPVGEAAGRLEEALVALSGADRANRREAWAAVERSTLALAEAVDAVRADKGSTGVGKASLLVVATDPEFRAGVQGLANGLFLDLVLADGEAEALERCRSRVPDAAIIDADLADATGLARSVRATPGCDGLPLAFAATDDGVSSRMAAVHAGASLFLRQPLDSEAFGAVVRNLTSAAQATRTHVLVADDDPSSCAWVEAILGRAGIRTTGLADSTTVLGAMGRLRPDLLLLDAAMPGLSGIDLCRMLRADPSWQDIPVLFLTADAAPENRIAAFQAGADDFLAKPLLAEELLSRVLVRAERARLRRERVEKDALTGLLLRGSFLAQVTARLAEADRTETVLSLCLIDLDEFKKVNHTYGHLAGDRVLAGLGELLGSRFRAEDVRGRWGGEEFAVAFPGQPSETIDGAVVRILDELGELEFIGDGGEVFQVQFSAGVAAFPEDGHSVELLLRAADRRLYLAKARGRGRVVSTG